jgi:hypothetical protein
MFVELIIHAGAMPPTTVLTLPRRPPATGKQVWRFGWIKRPFAAAFFEQAAGERMMIPNGAELLLPGALLVTIQAQLLTPFVFVNLCLAAFFQ